MSAPKVKFNTYVDIAMCMAIPDRDSPRSHKSISEIWEDQETSDTGAALTELDSEIFSSDALQLDWSERIQEWQKLHPDGGPALENWKTPEEFSFKAFFLQRPVVAIALWNLMQSFYALDRLVCAASHEQNGKVAEWEMLPIFKYLSARRIERRWRGSLQNLREQIKKKEIRDALLSRVADMSQGIVTLEDASSELERSFRENLKDITWADMMLRQIHIAVARRFSMIDTYLRVDAGLSNVTGSDGSWGNAEESEESSSEHDSEKPKVTPEAEPRFVRPRRQRRYSVYVMKRHFAAAWAATSEGEASVQAIFILSISMFCLRQVQKYLAPTI